MATAQIVLDDFTLGTQAGEGAALGTWAGQTTQNATTLTIGGTAHDDNGWGVYNLTPVFNATNLQLTVIGQLDTGHLAGSFNIQFFDTAAGSQAFSISSTAFQTGTMTTVNIALGPWTDADPANLNGWTIGGGSITTDGPAFRMTLDRIALTSSAIPEPSTYAAIAGALALAGAWVRRARGRAAV